EITEVTEDTDQTQRRRETDLCLCVRSVSSVPSVSSARDGPRDVRDLLARVPIVDALIHPAHPFTDRRVLDFQEVRQIGRPHVEAFVRRAEQESQLAFAEVRVLER